MRAPGSTFADALDVVRQRSDPRHEGQFFDRVRQCTGLPPAQRASDYPNLAEALGIAWEVASIWPRSAEITQERRETAIRQLDAIRLMRKDEVPFCREIEIYLNSLEELYMAQAQAYEPEELMILHYHRHDHLRTTDLGRERHSAGIRLFVREVSLAMRKIFGKPYDQVVGRLAGLAFETKALSPRTVRSMCRESDLIRQK
jgi:hypothetical protein